jgi:sensor c-di-GMP phosphodiesterase-like protein
VVTGHGAVHHDDRPVAVTARKIVHEGRRVERCLHSGGFVMVAGKAVHGRRGVAESLSQHCVAARIVMHEVAGEEHGVRPRVVALRVRDAAQALRRAIERHEFLVYYQPIVSLVSGKLTGFEALVRWAHKDGIRLPNDFIPLAEETGLIIPIENFVLRNAVKQMREWESYLKIGSGITMSVNLSPQHYSEANLVEDIKRLLLVTGFGVTFSTIAIAG